MRDRASIGGVRLRQRGEEFAVRTVERTAGQGVDGCRVVETGGMGHAADLGHLVHEFRHPRQMLTHGETGD